MVPLYTLWSAPQTDPSRSALTPEMQSIVSAMISRMERLECVLRSFAEHGATYGWIPDDAHRWETADWFEYLHRLDRTVQQRAEGALSDEPPSSSSERHRDGR
jgi:hypothetical protein